MDYHELVNINATPEERARLNIGDIWSNSARCRKCQTEICSNNKHDFVTCPCGAISVDGGSWYARRVAMDLYDVEDTSIMFNNLK